jgi:hypothetical protein
MKSTKTIIIAALAAGALLACGSSLRAQDATNMPPAGQHSPGPRGMFSMERIAKQLKLTDDVKAKVAPIIESLNKQIGDLRADTSLSREDKMAKRKAIMDDTTALLKPILTDEQFAQWQKVSTRVHRPPAPSPDNGGGTPPAAPPAGTPPQN